MKKPDGIPRPGQFLDYVLSRRGVDLPEIPGACVLTHSRRLLDLARERFSHRTVDIGARAPMEVHVVQPDTGARFAMVGAPPGAPMAVVILEELVALGIERFLCLGSAGHPVAGGPRRLEIADLLLVERALVYEGTSRHYDGADAGAAEPDGEATAALSRALDRCRLHYTRGSVATTDAIYRETPAFIREVVGRGALGVDMELSALFTASRFHRRRTAALVWISDVVGVDDGWALGFVEPQIDMVEESLLPAILEWVGQE